MVPNDDAFRVTLRHTDGTTVDLCVPPDETILDAADGQIDLPSACRWGACATCTGQLLEGDVDHTRRPRVLSEEQLEAGYVFLCIAQPRSDCVLRVGPELQDELLSE